MKRILLSIIIITVFSFGANAQNVNIPDANFKAYLVGNSAINTNGDTEIQVSEASAFNGQIDCNNLSISDLTGIEAFTSLTELKCNNNSLTSLDVTQNTALTLLWCGNNPITSLDVAQNAALTVLWCEYNSLTNLDVTQNTALTLLDCAGNSLTSLNVANGNNSNMPNSNFYVVGNPNLTCIQVDNVAYSTTNWTYFDATASFSTNCPCFVNIPDANFKAYLVGNTAINTNGNTEIECSEASAFTGEVSCYSSFISDLTGIEAFTNITGLKCNDNQLTSLDVTQNTALTLLFCHYNQLTALDVTQNTALITLYCYRNQLTALDVTPHNALAVLNCNENQLTTLNLSQNPLTFLNCNDNQLTNLNVANGNNYNLNGSLFNATNNLNLTCIQVDVVSYSTTNWTNIDPGASFSINCSGTVGINESKTTTINISPNPTKGLLNINTTEKVEQVTIYSISGSLVKNINQNVNQVNVQELTKGMYILVIKTEKGITRNRFIKE
tara:strand:- start:2482 stop:3975 length:1494 start_codon:yes stop_codon:yes gene_type:complete